MVGINSVSKLPLQHYLKATSSHTFPNPATTSKAPRANWNDAEITALINYLIKHMAEKL
jgi:hypothetical protein